MAHHYETLEVERSGRVATVWMNRPEVFNAFNEQLIAVLGQACAELDADAGVRPWWPRWRWGGACRRADQRSQASAPSAAGRPTMPSRVDTVTSPAT